MAKKILQREDLLYPELSYKIIGILFDVHNELGHGHAEKVYQRAIATALKNSDSSFEEQIYMPIKYQNQRVGSQYFDFFIEGKVVLEIKKGNRFVKSHMDQVYEYLVGNNLKLGILAYFAPQKLHFKRIINSDSYIRKHS